MLSLKKMSKWIIENVFQFFTAGEAGIDLNASPKICLATDFICDMTDGTVTLSDILKKFNISPDAAKSVHKVIELSGENGKYLAAAGALSAMLLMSYKLYKAQTPNWETALKQAIQSIFKQLIHGPLHELLKKHDLQGLEQAIEEILQTILMQMEQETLKHFRETSSSAFEQMRQEGGQKIMDLRKSYYKEHAKKLNKSIQDGSLLNLIQEKGYAQEVELPEVKSRSLSQPQKHPAINGLERSLQMLFLPEAPSKKSTLKS